jgi:hypothetical protein
MKRVVFDIDWNFEEGEIKDFNTLLVVRTIMHCSMNGSEYSASGLRRPQQAAERNVENVTNCPPKHVTFF